MLRRVASTVTPLAIRAVRSSRSFHNAIASSLSVEKRILERELHRGGFYPFMRFSTASATKHSSDESLIGVLQSEIECAETEESPDHKILEDLPDGFPFEIQDTPGERTILLKRQYQDEKITVEVDMPTVTEEQEENEDDEKNEEEGYQSSVPLVVSITKGNGLSLEFGVTAYPDEITIDSLSIKQPEGSEDQLAYEGPDFNDLDENLQKAFHKYLEIRGIKPSTTNFLLEYMSYKDSREYLQWLKNLKTFVGK